MLTHRSYWVSLSFCWHQCLSASQWSSSQRCCWGNSDRNGGESRKKKAQHQDSAVKSHWRGQQCLSPNYEMQQASYKNQDTHDSLKFPYLQYRQSLREYLGRVFNIFGRFNPLLSILPKIRKLLQGCIGLVKDRTRMGTRRMGYQQDLITHCVCVWRQQ